MKKLKIRRPPARPSAVVLKHTKPLTSAVKALDSLSIDRRPTHGNDGHFSTT
ncbi:hypothetical cytosolic protein [Coxiella burnetii CbuG_Q212]|nr:hypothetical cytosolic protein [Coxiella burnetii CbuG_Q212]